MWTGLNRIQFVSGRPACGSLTRHAGRNRGTVIARLAGRLEDSKEPQHETWRGAEPSGGVRFGADFFGHADGKAVAAFLTPAFFRYAKTAIFVA